MWKFQAGVWGPLCFNGQVKPAPSVRTIGSLGEAGETIAVASAALFQRYAELVMARGLCPFLRDTRSGQGDVWVALSRVRDMEAIVEAMGRHESEICHLLFPWENDDDATDFERWAAGLGKKIGERWAGHPVCAVFHPHLSGSTSASNRWVGLLRRSPIAFVQWVPPNLQSGGTLFVDDWAKAPPPRVPPLAERVGERGIEALAREVGELHAYRNELDALLRATQTQRPLL